MHGMMLVCPSSQLYEKTKSKSKKSAERPVGGPYSYITTKISSENNSDANTLICKIEYENDEKLEIKEEIIQDQNTPVNEVTGQKRNKKYESEWRSIGIRENGILGVKILRYEKEQKIQESKLEKKYKCEKCARTYKQKGHLTHHQKFECGAKPQFRCEFCGKQFKWNSVLKRHVNIVHLKIISKTVKTKHNCDKCSRSYTLLKNLNRHKLLEHADVKPQFTCDHCSRKVKEKGNLAKHIISKHLQS